MTMIIDGTAGITFPVVAATGSAVQASSGRVLQVVSVSTTTNTSTSSSSYVAVTNLTASITPSNTTSKILILVNANIYNSATGAENAMTIYRAGADLTSGNGFSDSYTGSSDLIVQSPMVYLDSPASTSSTTYAAYIKKTQGTGTVQVNLRGTTSTITLMEISA